MARGCCLSFLVLGTALLTSASSILPHQTDEESLKSALDAVTRKQRSLEIGPRHYYNDYLQNFKYHPNDAENDEKFARQQSQDLDNDDEDLEFLPIENGQLEDIGGGYQNFNNKRLERALMDYFENTSGQRDAAPSSFRERERTGGHKRAIAHDRLTSDPDKDLAALFYKELQNGPAYGNMADLDSQDYPFSDTLQSYYDKYRAEQAKLDRNKLYQSNGGPISWDQMIGKQEGLLNRNGKKIDDNESNDEMGEEEEDEEDEGNAVNGDSMYLLPAERRNVNGRYPIGREYGLLLKRYPVAKRSAKPPHHEKEGVITDPKVAKDLGALFGSQKMADNNHTTDKHDHDHDHSAHDHSVHNHDHSAHDHDHSAHDHDHGKHPDVADKHALESTSSESPKMEVNSAKVTPGQKETTNSNVNNNRANKMLSKRADNQHIELRKKSVDWSQYFGIDRRKKKAAFLARPGSQDQDDEWMLQRYYKTMAEDLKSSDKESHHDDKDNGEKRDKLDQMDARLKNVKNLIVEDALKYGNEENPESQDVKDVVMARLAAAYSLEKMRRALNEFRSNIAAHRDLMRAAHLKNNSTNDDHDETTRDDKTFTDNNHKKWGRHAIEDEENPYEGRNYEGFDEGSGCPELEEIERNYAPLKGGRFERLYDSCIENQICLACDSDGDVCRVKYLREVHRVCLSFRRDRKDREQCYRDAYLCFKEPSPMVVSSCRLAGANSCMRRHYRYRQRAPYYQNAMLPHDLLDVNQQIGER